MSAVTWTGNVLTSIEISARSAFALPAGAAGWEVGVRPFEVLDPSQFPHVFNGDYTESRTLLDFGQEEVRAAWVLQLWTYNETLEALLAKVDAFDGSVRGSTWALINEIETLHIVSIDVVEHMAKPYKVALIGIEFIELVV